MLSIKRLTSKLGLIFPVLLLVVVELCLFKANYKPGTWLIGWDSTQPELNLKLNLFRILNSVWQEYRGLGLLDGMAHGANLIHWLYVYLLHLFLPANLIRYVFIFLMHFLGGLGMFFFLKKIFKTGVLVSFLGATFYLLNPAIIQMFYSPLEVFVIHFAFLPWLFWVLINYLNSPSKKNLLHLFLVNLLSVSQSHVPSIFLVYLFGVLVTTLFYLKNWRQIIVCGLIIFSTNAFWALPFGYSALKNAEVIVNSKINRLSDPEVILMNRSFGDLKSVILLRSFNLDYGDWNNDGAYGFQMPVWREFLNRQNIEVLGYILFSFAVLGVITGLFKRQKLYVPFVIILLFVFSGLATDAPVVSKIGSFLSDKIPFYKEVFRFSFTKFAVFYAFCLSVFIGVFLEIFSGKFTKWFRCLVAIGLIAVIFVVAQPTFKGEFLYDKLKLNVPSEYFELFSYFDGQKDDGRIVVLPQPSFWNWEYSTWGYRGSGIIWQGIAKPLLHRAFDPWSAYNETYFNELNDAISRKDKTLFNRVLKKYKARWIILDECIYQPGGWEKDFFTKEAYGLIENNSEISLIKDFGKIKVYRVGFDLGGKYISVPETYTAVNADLTYSQLDPVYAKYGDYISAPITDNRLPITAFGFPFVNFDPRGPVTIKISNDKLQIANEEQNAKVILPIENNIIETFGQDRGFKEVYNCDLKKTGIVYKSHLVGGISYKADDGGVACDYFSYPTLKPGQAYVLRVKGENIQGRSLKVYFQNWATNRMDLEELLPEGKFDSYFVVFGGPHTLNLETRSFGRIASENVIESIELYPFDINFLTGLTQNSEKLLTQTNNLKILSVRKTGTAFYQVKIEGEGLLQLGQGYENGWKAFSIQFSVISKLEHVKVNSWANGWLVPTDHRSLTTDHQIIYIIFWPQLLEWGGMILGILVSVHLLVDKRKG